MSATPEEFMTEIGGWHNLMPADLMVEQDGKQMPMRDHPFVKESKDLPAFAKRAFDTHREVGSRIPLKVDKTNAEAVATWRKENLPKLYEAGVLERPPASAKDYKIAKPEKMPDGLAWSDERAGKMAEVAFKHGISPAAIPDLMALHEEALGSVLDQVQEISKTTEAEAETALRREFPTDYEQRQEQAKRLTKLLFKSEEELRLYEDTGLANSPTFLGVLMRLAPLAASDSSMGLRMTEGTLTREEVQSQLADIISNVNNPKHKLYMMGDPATLEFVDSLYKKIPGGTEKVVIG